MPPSGWIFREISFSQRPLSIGVDLYTINMIAKLFGFLVREADRKELSGL